MTVLSAEAQHVECKILSSHMHKCCRELLRASSCATSMMCVWRLPAGCCRGLLAVSGIQAAMRLGSAHVDAAQHHSMLTSSCCQLL